MSTEIEIKFELNEACVKTISDFLKKRFGKGDKKRIENGYFDTKTLLLSKAKTALRMRKIGDQYFQTLKRANQAEEGFHKRDEWEEKIEGNQFNFERFSDLPAPLKNLLNNNELYPLFETNFWRTKWLAKIEGTLVEIALDQGEIIAQNQKEAICELELELKSGDISTLKVFAKELSARFDLKYFNQTKAERGYMRIED